MINEIGNFINSSAVLPQVLSQSVSANQNVPSQAVANQEAGAQGEVIKSVMQILANVLNSLLGLISKLINAGSATAGGAAAQSSTVQQNQSTSASPQAATAADTFGSIGKVLDDLIGWITGDAQGIVKKVTDLFSGIGEKIGGLFGGSSLIGSATSFISKAIGKIF